jgi:predicted transcriptional regulator
MDRPTLGEQEMEVLRYVAEHAPISGNEVAEAFGEPRGLARSTVLTVIERLRKKGYLSRERDEGVYRYSPRLPQSEVLVGLLQRFVETTLGGSLSPVVAYLARAEQLSERDVEELQRLVDGIKARSKERS